MLKGNRLKRIAYALILAGLALFLLLRHRDIEENGDLHWFDRPILFVTVPVAKGIRAVRDSIQSVVQRYFLLVDVEKENEELRRRLDEARGRALFHEEANRENERLHGLLDLKSQLPGEWVAARVVATPTISPYRVITIDKGSEAGIARRAAVASPDGLVGQVVRVFPRLSQVLLITDPTSAVDGRIVEVGGASGAPLAPAPRTGEAGFSSHTDPTGSRALIVGRIMKTEMKRDIFVTAFDYLDRTTQIADGTKVMTSGMDGVYPPGIPIGHVRGSKTKKYDIFQQAEVLPAVDFYKLREVMVLR